VTVAPVLLQSSAACAQDENHLTPDGKPMKYHAGVASDPGMITISMPKLTWLEPLLSPTPGAKEGGQLEGAASAREKVRLRQLDVIREHLSAGDSRAAVVINVEPLLVAAYSDDLDCIAMLKFPKQLVKEHNLKVGSHLLTVNTFETKIHRKTNASDLHFGPKQLHPYTNVFPIIADFVTDDKKRLDRRKATISDDEWKLCESLGNEYHKKYPDVARNGSPLFSNVPAVVEAASEEKK
jgi:hypothetical protein